MKTWTAYYAFFILLLVASNVHAGELKPDASTDQMPYTGVGATRDPAPLEIHTDFDEDGNPTKIIPLNETGRPIEDKVEPDVSDGDGDGVPNYEDSDPNNPLYFYGGLTDASALPNPSTSPFFVESEEAVISPDGMIMTTPDGTTYDISDLNPDSDGDGTPDYEDSDPDNPLYWGDGDASALPEMVAEPTTITTDGRTYDIEDLK